MSREKQIEEIFNDVVESEHRFHEYCLANTCHDCEYYGDGECDNHIRAEYLYNAGYRKQSEGEWIKPTSFSQTLCSKCRMTPKMLLGLLPKYCPNCGAKMKGGAE